MVTQSELETEGELGNSDQTIDILLGQYQITEEYCWLMQISACITYKKKHIIYDVSTYMTLPYGYGVCWMLICVFNSFVHNKQYRASAHAIRTHIVYTQHQHSTKDKWLICAQQKQ